MFKQFTVIIFVSCYMHAVLCQRTSQDSDCIYTFHVPKEDIKSACPTGNNLIAENEKDSGLTKAQMTTLITNQQEQLAMLTKKISELEQQSSSYTEKISLQEGKITLLSDRLMDIDKQHSVYNSTTLNVSMVTRRVSELEQQSSSYNEKISLQEEKINLLSDKLMALEKHNAVYNSTTFNKSMVTQRVNGSGINYIRWGRTICPDAADILYTGFIGKSKYNQVGGGVDYICLHNTPEWQLNRSSTIGPSYIHGCEYQQNSIFPDLADADAPCVACVVKDRSQQIMIPGRITCEPGWVAEYSGVLMSAFHTETKANYICVDLHAEAVPGGHPNDNGGVMFTVQAKCDGSMPCPPYKDGYVISCVVCTR